MDVWYMQSRLVHYLFMCRTSKHGYWQKCVNNSHKLWQAQCRFVRHGPFGNCGTRPIQYITRFIRINVACVILIRYLYIWVHIPVFIHFELRRATELRGLRWSMLHWSHQIQILFFGLSSRQVRWGTVNEVWDNLKTLWRNLYHVILTEIPTLRLFFSHISGRLAN